MQRQKRVLYQRLRVPPAVNQFSKTLQKYQSESKKDKVARLLKLAESKEAGKEVDSKRPYTLKFGLNHVTKMVEDKKAKLVVIAHDVDPIELVLWLPALCRSQGVPYCIVKDKARLGRVVRQSTASCVAITEVRKEDANDLEKVASMARSNFNESNASFNTYGAPVMGNKAQHKLDRIERL